MGRFFISAVNINSRVIRITGTDAAHMAVLRIKTGDIITVCDGEGTDYECRVINFTGGTVEAEITERSASPGEPSVDCTVLCGFPKSDKADLIVQKCTEVGAVSVVFFDSARCVSKPDSRGIAKKLERWQRIAEEAAKQSGRGIIPHIDTAKGFDNALEIAHRSELPLFLYEAGERVPIKAALSSNPGVSSISLITGPEGGFEPEEAANASSSGMLVCSMGPRILRCETAPIIALASIMFHSGNL